MSYIGNNTQTQSFTPNVDYFSGNGSTTAFTLSRNVASVNQIQVFIGNTPQNPIFSYTVSGNTINFITAPVSGTNNIYIYYVSSLTQTIAPSQNTVLPSSLSVSNALYWDAKGNVGIGTTSTENKFNVLGNAQITGYGTVQSLNLQGGNNLLLQSQTLNITPWTVLNTVTVSADSTTAPDGTTTADTVTNTSNPTFSTDVLYQSATATLTGRSYTFSVWLKSGTTSTATLFVNQAGSTQRTFNVVTPTANWQRFSVTGSFTSESSDGKIYFHIAPGNANTSTGAGSIYAWGAQLELGSVASNYTPTTTAAVTTTNNINVPSGNINVPSGQVLGANGTKTLPTYSFGAGSNSGFYQRAGSAYVMLSLQGAETVFFNPNYSIFSQSIQLASGNVDVNTADVCLHRDSANTLAQRYSTNAQTFRLYNTYTDASNYERLGINWSSNTATIQTENAGTGTRRALAFGQDVTINTVTVGLGGGAVSTNTAVGNGAMAATATGTGNVGVGQNALHSVSSGYGNNAFGVGALYTNSSGYNNSAFGQYSLYQNTTGFNNLAFGNGALNNNTTGSNNSAFGGLNTLVTNTTASNLVAFGTQALNNNTTNVATLGSITGGTGYTNGTYTGVVMTLSSGSTALTYPTATIVVSGGAVTSVTLTSNGVAFKDTTTVLTAPAASIGGTGSGFTVPVATLASGTGNVAVGYQAGYTNSVGTNNTFNGYQAGYSGATANSNSYYGYQAGYYGANTSSCDYFGASAGLGASNASGSGNAGFGRESLTSIVSGSSNVAIGRGALYSQTTGNNCVAIGFRAGYASSANANTIGSNNIYIGYQTVGSANNNTNEMVIGYQAVGLGSNTTVIGNSSTTRTKVFGAIESSGYTVATLPTPSIGMQTYVTDGDSGLAWGATVVNSGSGATKYLVWYNGTNWTVVGK